MKYYSLNFNSKNVSFAEAVTRGLAPDRGLYFPASIPELPANFFENIHEYSDHEIAFNAIQPFIGDTIQEKALKKIIQETLTFDFPLVPIGNKISSLELYHGPTLAFKDVGARFMARCLSHFNSKNKSQKIVVLVATSGDTGGAVADGFLGVPGIDVVILYPKGKVSPIQEKQLTTLGQNITALEIDGVFDDCQDMVKSAFLDVQINQKLQLTSANSINVARWLPQMFYYFFAYKALVDKKQPLVFSVPSGNFGNLCAGLLAKKMGLPIDRFIASTNVNNAVPEYLNSGQYSPKKTIATISNAMDVGAPSNFIRIQKLFNHDFHKLGKILSGFSYSDTETKKGLKKIHENALYIADPHGAVAYLGLSKFLDNNPEYYGVFLETAHPIKFNEVVEKTLGIKIPIPEKIMSTLDRQKVSIPISNYQELKSFLMDL